MLINKPGNTSQSVTPQKMYSPFSQKGHALPDVFFGQQNKQEPVKGSQPPFGIPWFKLMGALSTALGGLLLLGSTIENSINPASQVESKTPEHHNLFQQLYKELSPEELGWVLISAGLLLQAAGAVSVAKDAKQPGWMLGQSSKVPYGIALAVDQSPLLRSMFYFTSFMTLAGQVNHIKNQQDILNRREWDFKELEQLFSKENLRSIVGPEASENYMAVLYQSIHKVLQGDPFAKAAFLKFHKLLFSMGSYIKEDIQYPLSTKPLKELKNSKNDLATQQGPMLGVAAGLALSAGVLSMTKAFDVPTDWATGLNIAAQGTSFASSMLSLIPILVRAIQHRRDVDGKLLLVALPGVVVHQSFGITANDPVSIGVTQGYGSISEALWFIASVLNTKKYESLRDYIDGLKEEAAHDPNLKAEDVLKRFGWMEGASVSEHERGVLHQIKKRGAQELKTILSVAQQREQEDGVSLWVSLNTVDVLSDMQTMLSQIQSGTLTERVAEQGSDDRVYLNFLGVDNPKKDEAIEEDVAFAKSHRITDDLSLDIARSAFSRAVTHIMDDLLNCEWARPKIQLTSDESRKLKIRVFKGLGVLGMWIQKLEEAGHEVISLKTPEQAEQMLASVTEALTQRRGELYDHAVRLFGFPKPLERSKLDLTQVKANGLSTVELWLRNAEGTLPLKSSTTVGIEYELILTIQQTLSGYKALKEEGVPCSAQDTALYQKVVQTGLKALHAWIAVYENGLDEQWDWTLQEDLRGFKSDLLLYTDKALDIFPGADTPESRALLNVGLPVVTLKNTMVRAWDTSGRMDESSLGSIRRGIAEVESDLNSLLDQYEAGVQSGKIAFDGREAFGYRQMLKMCLSTHDALARKYRVITHYDSEPARIEIEAFERKRAIFIKRMRGVQNFAFAMA